MTHPDLIPTLDGLRVGDAFGFKLSIRPAHVAQRLLPEAPWYWSDDAAMAAAVTSVLLEFGHIDQDALFAEFVARYRWDPRRGYGAGMKKLLGETAPDAWRTASASLFSGRGSFGNGAAMRVATLGVFFAHDMDRVIEQAKLSAQVTHTHHEGIAGAVAIACAAALKHTVPTTHARELITRVAELTPESDVRRGIEASLQFEADAFDEAVATLGNGSRITAPDTVPLCVWWSAHAPNSYEETMWQLVQAKGDEDTNCAIVGGILAAGGLRPPSSWLEATEDAPDLEPMRHDEATR